MEKKNNVFEKAVSQDELNQEISSSNPEERAQENTIPAAEECNGEDKTENTVQTIEASPNEEKAEIEANTVIEPNYGINENMPEADLQNESAIMVVPQPQEPSKKRLLKKKGFLVILGIISLVIVIGIAVGGYFLAYNLNAIDVEDYIVVYLEQDGNEYDAKTITIDYEKIATDNDLHGTEDLEEIFEYVLISYKDVLKTQTYDKALKQYPKKLKKSDIIEISINWDSLAKGNLERIEEIEKELGIHFNHSNKWIEIYVSDIVRQGRVEEKKPDFKALYEKFCDAKFAKVGDDGSYLKLDSNPQNYDSDSYYYYTYTYLTEVDKAVSEINNELGVPDSVIEKMNNTTWSQGIQKEEYNTFTISWTYHPDKGFEVTYEIKNN